MSANSWREDPPTDHEIKTLNDFGIPVPETRGEASRLITKAKRETASHPPLSSQIAQFQKLKALGVPFSVMPDTRSEAAELLATAPSEKQISLMRELDVSIPLTSEQASSLISKRLYAPTPKQIAKIEYFKLSVPDSKREASELLDEIESDSLYKDERKMWELEKYDLHPDLYDESSDHMLTRMDRLREVKSSGCLVMLVPLAVIAGIAILKVIT